MRHRIFLPHGRVWSTGAAAAHCTATSPHSSYPAVMHPLCHEPQHIEAQPIRTCAKHLSGVSTTYTCATWHTELGAFLAFSLL